MQRLLLSLFLLLFAGASLHASVGVVSALRGIAHIDRGSVTRQAAIGDPIEKHDIVRTGPRTQMQILFKDRTVVTLGHSSRLRVDDYLFGDAADSKTDLSMTKGFFRTVTGRIGKIAPQKFKLHTANATIGIRGTEILIQADPEEGDTIACVMGRIVVTSLATGGSVELKAGESVTVKSKGAVSSPKKMDTPSVETLMQGMAYTRTASNRVTTYRENAFEDRTAKTVEEEIEQTLPDEPEDPDEPEEPGNPDEPEVPGDTIKETVYEYDFLSLGFLKENDGKPIDTWMDTGTRTPEGVIREYKATQVTADYRGNVVAIADGEQAAGQMNMHFDFGNESFDGTLDFKSHDGPRWIVYMKGEGPSRLRDDGTFNSRDVSSAAGTEVEIQNGKLDGAFYGPNAENVGGTFKVSGEGGRKAEGHFGGERP
jgi:hypothetical protein